MITKKKKEDKKPLPIDLKNIDSVPLEILSSSEVRLAFTQYTMRLEKVSLNYEPEITFSLWKKVKDNQEKVCSIRIYFERSIKYTSILAANMFYKYITTSKTLNS